MLVGTGGGGQSGQMADAGSCGQHACYATFVHEFGHQLGLDHAGFWDAGWSPTYPSLLNYSYSYQLNGRGEGIGYSNGLLASMVLDERSLDEYLPVPPGSVGYLSGPPYRYKIKPALDGKGTLIDWNWNGVFGETNIAADINYGYSTNAGPRHKPGRSRSATTLVAHGQGDEARLLFVTGDLRRDEKGAPITADGKPLIVDASPALRLYMKVWQGSDPVTEGDRWSDETVVEPDGMTGDPVGVYAAGATWIAYPMADGVHTRRVTLDEKGAPTIGAAELVPGSAGVQPTLVPWGGSLLMLSWRDAKAPVTFRAVDLGAEPPVFGPERDLPVISLVPVGAAPSPDGQSLWIGLTEDQDAGRPTRWQVRRLTRNAADGSFAEAQREWVGGPDAQHRGEGRVVVLCEPNPGFPDGQVYFLQCGMMGGSPRSSCHYIGMRVKNQDVHGGWLVRRYYDEWSTSSSAPGACLFRDDIAYVMRWAAAPDSDGSTELHVGFFGRGFDHGKMGDFDDVTFIRDIGLTHSIPCAGRLSERAGTGRGCGFYARQDSGGAGGSGSPSARARAVSSSISCQAAS
jgi:hypothetical protein